MGNTIVADGPNGHNCECGQSFAAGNRESMLADLREHARNCRRASAWLAAQPDNDCQQCGLRISSVVPHTCGLPILRNAIGLELTDEEERHIRWLAGKEHATIEIVAGLFGKVRECLTTAWHSEVADLEKQNRFLIDRVAELTESNDLLLDAGEGLLELIDEVPDELPGGQSDRVFARYEFDAMRNAVEKAQQ